MIACTPVKINMQTLDQNHIYPCACWFLSHTIPWPRVGQQPPCMALTSMERVTLAKSILVAVAAALKMSVALPKSCAVFLEVAGSSVQLVRTARRVETENPFEGSNFLAEV